MSLNSTSTVDTLLPQTRSDASSDRWGLRTQPTRNMVVTYNRRAPDKHPTFTVIKPILMKFDCGEVYHIYNQGNNRQRIFDCHKDYWQFVKLTKEYIVPYCDILALWLLPNHFHYMIYANEKSIIPHRQGNLTLDSLTNGYRKMLSAYSHDFNKRNNRSGSLFRPKQIEKSFKP